MKTRARRIKSAKPRIAIEGNYFHCFEKNPLPMLIMQGQNFAILAANQAACELYGYSRSEFRQVAMSHLVDETDFRDVQTFLKNDRQTRSGKSWKHRRKNGTQVEVEILIAEVDFGNLIATLLVLNDITDRVAAERALFASEERFSKTFYSSPVAVCITRLEDGLFLDANEQFLEVTGYNRGDLSGRTEADVAIWTDLAQREHFVKTLVTGGTVRNFEKTLQTKSGDERIVLISADIVGVPGCACLLIMIHDVTEAYKNRDRIRSYQRELRSLAAQLSLAEEGERRRIANAIHDHVGQNLAMMKIKLGGVKQQLQAHSAVADLDKIRDLLEETLQATRSLSFELSPPVLYEVGFEAAVEWLAERTENDHGIHIEVEDDGSVKPLDEAVKVTLFTVVRELFTNIVKHSKAQKASVSMRRQQDQIIISIQDFGIGFHLPHSRPSKQKRGFGLFSIRERIRDMGGELRITSRAGHGTDVLLKAPLKQGI